MSIFSVSNNTAPFAANEHAAGVDELSFREAPQDNTVVLGWRKYIRDHYRTDEEVTEVFGVTMRTAQYWRNASDRAPRAVHMAIAMVEHGPSCVFKYITGQG